MSKPIKLKPRKGNGACGPTVIACITGAAVEKIEHRIKLRRYGRRRTVARVRGTTTREVRACLAYFGYTMSTADASANSVEMKYTATTIGRWRGEMRIDTPTLGQWLASREDSSECNIVHIANHWIVVQGNELADTYSGGAPIPWSKSAHLRKRVRGVYMVRKS